MQKNTELLSIERKVRGAWTSITSNNCMWISGEREAHYLLKGHATELIDKVWLPQHYQDKAYPEIYGVVAANQSDGRYVWIYLYYRHHLWKCNDIRKAYDIIEKIKEHDKLEKKERVMRRKFMSQQKLLSVCKN